MKFYKRVLKLHQFRNLGRNSATELLLNSSFEEHGGLVILGWGKTMSAKAIF
ncbi:hypothetical protein HpNP61_01120 [Helicobacter pylori]